MRMVLKLFPLVMAVALLSSCAGPQETVKTSCTPQEIAAVILNSQKKESPFFLEKPEGDIFDTYVSDCYQIPDNYVSDGAICTLGGVEAAEIAVLKLADLPYVDKVETLLQEYLGNRVSTFGGYAPEQAAMVENGRVHAIGNYVALLLCEDPDTAAEAFCSCFDPDATLDADYDFAEPDTSTDILRPEHLPFSAEDEIDPTHLPAAPGNITADLLESEVADNQYHADLVLDAWQSGDSSNLGTKDKAILEAASAVIAMEVSDDMAPWEKEVALHDWLIYNVNYDAEALSNLPTATPDPDGDDPYGPLVKGIGTCNGYSSTFKLFMDMVGIPCVTVKGIANTGEDHAWNKVQLDGEWYCVDTTWDDPIDGESHHILFNVTDEFLFNLGFQWDNTTSPEANGTQYAYGNLEVN